LLAEDETVTAVADAAAIEAAKIPDFFMVCVVEKRDEDWS
jgi:hypothetical protein